MIAIFTYNDRTIILTKIGNLRTRAQRGFSKPKNRN